MTTPSERWQTLAALADAIRAKAKAKKNVILSPETANMVAHALEHADAKPSRNEVAMMICRLKCSVRCYTCTGVANVIVNAYGESWEKR